MIVAVWVLLGSLPVSLIVCSHHNVCFPKGIGGQINKKYHMVGQNTSISKQLMIPSVKYILEEMVDDTPVCCIIFSKFQMYLIQKHRQLSWKHYSVPKQTTKSIGQHYLWYGSMMQADLTDV